MKHPEHICRFNDAPQSCTCYDSGYDDAIQSVRGRVVTEDTSDGYHTFKELYEFRKLYNAALFNEWAAQHKYEVHKSEQHSDGEFCFGGGWFIVMATLPTGQISNHYEMKDWDLFKCRVAERADVWDGHTSQDVAQRLTDLLKDLEAPVEGEHNQISQWTKPASTESTMWVGHCPGCCDSCAGDHICPNEAQRGIM